MQRVVIGRLPMRAMRCLRQCAVGHVLYKASMSPLPVAAAVFEVCVGRQMVPCRPYAAPPLRPVVWQAQGLVQICWGKQTQTVLAECLGRGFLNGSDIEHCPILLDGDLTMLEGNGRKVLEVIGKDAEPMNNTLELQKPSATKPPRDAISPGES